MRSGQDRCEAETSAPRRRRPRSSTCWSEPRCASPPATSSPPCVHTSLLVSSVMLLCVRATIYFVSRARGQDEGAGGRALDQAPWRCSPKRVRVALRESLSVAQAGRGASTDSSTCGRRATGRGGGPLHTVCTQGQTPHLLEIGCSLSSQAWILIQNHQTRQLTDGVLSLVHLCLEGIRTFYHGLFSLGVARRIRVRVY